jgi:hypothetical protein
MHDRQRTECGSNRGIRAVWETRNREGRPGWSAPRHFREFPYSIYLIISKWRSSLVSSVMSMNLLQMVVTMLITPW